LEERVPKMAEGLLPTTSLRTEELTLGWRKLVVSPLRMEKLCQSMMAPLLLTTLRVLPLVLRLAVPETTLAPVGFPHNAEGTKANQLKRDHRKKPEKKRKRDGDRLLTGVLFISP